MSMDWTYQGNIVTEMPESCTGFVYIITNITNNKKYIGKKLARFKKSKTRTVKLKNGNKKRKRIRYTIESDWKDYFGSNQELLEDVQLLGADKFSREILYYCTSKAECSYLELIEQIRRRVLESADYYNGIIQVRIHKNHVNERVQKY